MVTDQPAPLLARVQDVDDRRHALVALTPEGEEILTRVMVENRRVLTAVEGVFNDLCAALAMRLR